MSPILSCTHAPTQISTIDLTGDSESDSESDIDNDPLWKEVEEYRRRLEEKEAKRQDTIETDSESDAPTQIIPCPASPTKVRELAQWHPLPEDLGDNGEENTKFSQEDEAWERGEVLDYLRSSPDDTTHRWWKATVFSDYTDNNQKEICMAVEYFESIYASILKIASIICAVMGIEICPKTHRIHAHIIMGFLNAKAYTTLRNKIGISQIRWLTTDQEIIGWYDYVVKAFSKITHPRRILRYGEDKILQKKSSLVRVNKRSHRDMFYDNQQAIEEGRFDEIDPLFRFDHMSKIQKWYNEQHKAAVRVDHDRLVFIWGNPGVITILPRKVHQLVEERLDIVVPFPLPYLEYSVTYISKVSVISWRIGWELVDPIPVLLISTASFESCLPNHVQSPSSFSAQLVQ